jgi:hypothetical protein
MREILWQEAGEAAVNCLAVVDEDPLHGGNPSRERGWATVGMRCNREEKMVRQRKTISKACVELANCIRVGRRQ